MILYGTARSSVAHALESCACRNGARVAPLSDEARAGRTACKRCADVCLSCGDICPKGGCHSLCDECALAYSQSIAVATLPLPCPCGSGLPIAVSEEVERLLLAHHAGQAPACSPAKRCPVDRKMEEILVTKCPHCGRAYHDFDGCCSVQCVCRGFFCAFCLHPSRTNEASHEHVLQCPHNPRRGHYFVAEASLPEIGRAIRRRRVPAAVLALVREEGCLEAAALLRDLSRRRWESVASSSSFGACCAGLSLASLLCTAYYRPQIPATAVVCAFLW